MVPCAPRLVRQATSASSSPFVCALEDASRARKIRNREYLRFYSIAHGSPTTVVEVRQVVKQNFGEPVSCKSREDQSALILLKKIKKKKKKKNG